MKIKKGDLIILCIICIFLIPIVTSLVLEEDTRLQSVYYLNHTFISCPYVSDCIISQTTENKYLDFGGIIK